MSGTATAAAPIELDEPAAASGRTPMLRGLWFAVIVLLIAGPVSAVIVNGRSDEAASTLATITASATSVDDAKTVVVTSRSTTKVHGGPTLVFRAVFAVDNEARLGRFTMSTEGVGVPDLDVVLAGDTMFVRVPDESQARAATGGKAWIAAAVPPGTDAKASNPAAEGVQLLHHLAGARGDVTEVGDDKINGVPTTHYRVGIDYDDVTSRDRARRSGLGLMPPGASAADVEVTAAPADIWLDEAGRPRKFMLTLSMEVGGTKAVTSTDNEYDYETPVSVEVPPADQAHPASSVADAFKIMYRSIGPAAG